MKKRIKILISIILIILLFPLPVTLKDGGTVEYKAIIYKFSIVHQIQSEITDETIISGYKKGIILEIFGKEIFNNTKIKWSKEEKMPDSSIPEGITLSPEKQ